ncbi:MAG: SDR family oxidoreductase [Gammaproteobacteria bacterium]|nr:SDR family oxidoreductase [Gammaproteobacteria bacterium]
MNLSLEGKHALVCGSSQGIGKAIAIQLAKQGASITLFARNAEALEKVKAELDGSQGQKHLCLTADFSKPDQVLDVVSQHLSSVNFQYQILINNTGGPAPGPAHLSDSQAFLSAFNQHLINNQNLVQALLPGMKSSNFGRVINVISTSVKQPLPNLGVSNTVRGAVANWAKTLANELGPFDITVNNVLPGATATARLDAIIANKAKKLDKTLEQVTEMEKSIIPLRRFGLPEEFANAVGFLASPAAAYITGTNLPVDGGRTGCL